MFPSDFTTNSLKYGCPRPCRWYRYRAKCEDVKADKNGYIEMLKERGNFQQSNSHDDEDVVKVNGM